MATLATLTQGTFGNHKSLRRRFRLRRGRRGGRILAGTVHAGIAASGLRSQRLPVRSVVFLLVDQLIDY